VARLGVQLPVSMSVPERVDLARWAEQHGFDDVWTAEIGDPDAFVVLAAAACHTQHARLGTMIVPLGVRTAVNLAAAASSVCQLAPGRFGLGLGVSTPAVIDGWHGADFARPLTRTRETIALLRAVFAGDPTDFDGQTLRSHGFRLNRLPEPPPPISLAALNPKMLRLAGAIADGIWLNFAPLEAIPRILAEIDEGARSAGRARPEILMSIITCVTADVRAVAARYRSWFKFYLRSASYQQALSWYGYEQEVEHARAALAAGDRDSLAAAVSPRLIEGLTAFGSAADCNDVVDAYAKAGVDTIVVIPYGASWMETLDAFVR
jgi:probable F420-dependent oxidoreductase